MECKAHVGQQQTPGSMTVLIETLWNVKHNISLSHQLRYSVLIETLWNVKKTVHEKRCDASTVLIETLWNVKNVGYHMDYREEQSINRNIVECKEGRATTA